MLEEYIISDADLALIRAALVEDIGQGDITSEAVIAEDAEGIFAFTAREDMVICGMKLAELIFSNAITTDSESTAELEFEARCHDGDSVKAGEQFAIISGNLRKILRYERVALNFLQHLSGIATLTKKFAAKTCNTHAKILDTRKTTPAYRELEKYAVRCGGGENHRMRLDDMVLIKDNHITAAGGVKAAVEKARNYLNVKNIDAKIELEVDDLEQLEQGLQARPDIVMLDNFSIPQLQKAVEICGEKMILEASGGVNLETVEAIAKTGVHRISTSKITQSAPAVDIGLDEV